MRGGTCGGGMGLKTFPPDTLPACWSCECSLLASSVTGTATGMMGGRVVSMVLLVGTVSPVVVVVVVTWLMHPE